MKGVLTFANNEVMLQKIIPPIQNTNGTLTFNEKGFALNAMTSTFLGGPVQAAGGTQTNGTSQIKISGMASIAGLRGNYPNASTQSLLSHASGSTPYNATVSIHDHHTELRVDSSMQGLALNFPAPLRKAANDNMPFKFVWMVTPTSDVAAITSAPLNDVIKLSLGTTIMAQYQRQKSAEKNAEWWVLRGGIGINVAAPEPESGLSLHLQAKSLNVDEWHKLANLANDGVGNSAENKTSSNASEIGQYITPNAVAVHATELTLLDKKLNNVVVGATYQNNIWQANIDATQASGFITWSESRSGRGLGKVTARLSSLHIPESATADVKDLLESKDAATQIPSLD
ncbi:MAG: TIGR02099 family protein, partial [Glaciimonas sp.]|nr:TIGR02099 family protein [Glaciimonas sp.]